MRFITILLLSALLTTVAHAQRQFIAMEYIGGISNRILKVTITDSLIFAARVKGMTSEGIAPRGKTGFVIAKDMRFDPNNYVNPDMDSKYSAVDYLTITPLQFMAIDSKNFVIRKKDIEKFYYDPTKKWGMGGYPHNGKIFVVSKPGPFNNKKTREFILVGIQDQRPILEWIGH